MRFTLIAQIIFATVSTAMRLSCDPGEEFKSHNLTCDVSQSSSPFTWRYGSDVVSICQPPFQTCETQSAFDGSYAAFLIDRTIILNVKNVTRQTVGKYSCSGAQTNVETCDFRIYALRLPCDPGEEFKSHNLTCDISQGSGPFIWNKGSSLISTCSSTCSTYDASYTTSFIDQTIILKIMNVSRRSEGMYSCSDAHSNVETCDFRIYARPESVSCQVSELQTEMTNIKVSCTATKIYPFPICQFLWIRNGTEMSLTQAITYQNMSAQGQPGYFYSTCILTQSVQNLGLGSHQFKVRVYPNVTGSSSDINYGRDSNLTPNVRISYPTVQVECPQGYVLEGSQFNCSCRETANHFLSPSTSLSQESTVQSSGAGFTSHGFTANRSMGDGPDNVAVKVMQNQTETKVINLCDKSQPVMITVACEASADGVSPRADYEFTINGSKVSANPESSSYLTYTVTNGGPLQVQCNGSNSVFKQVTASSQLVLQVAEPPTGPPIIEKHTEDGTFVAGTYGHLTVQEGINRIRCRVEGGYPLVSSLSVGCGTQTNTSVGNVAFVDVNMSRYMNASECSCTANHILSCIWENTTVSKLDVLFVPTIVSFTTNESKVQEEIIVERNSDVRFSCEAEGNLSPRLFLLKDGVQLATYSNPSQKFNLSLKFNKTKIDCQDAGVYSCQALTIGQGQTGAVKTMDVNVKCPQQLELPGIQNMVYKAKVSGKRDIMISVFGYPQPHLHLDSDRILKQEEYNLTYISLRPSYGNVSLSIYHVTDNVFQNYSLSIINSEGTFIYNFQIQEEVAQSPNSGGDGSDVGAIVGGIVAGIVVIVLVVLVLTVVLFKRRGLKNNGNKEKNTYLNIETIPPAKCRAPDYENQPADVFQDDVLSHSPHVGKMDVHQNSPHEETRDAHPQSPYEDISDIPKNPAYEEIRDFAQSSPYEEIRDVPPHSTYDEIRGVQSRTSRQSSDYMNTQFIDHKHRTVDYENCITPI